MTDNRILFTKEMKETHTILIPTMLPNHFRIMEKILQIYGYKTELLVPDRARSVQSGLRYVHNDSCYPATLVIGQFIDALESGRYDRSRVALLITQTGGGCRASNYIALLRKALAKAGYGDVPVVSFSVSGGMEKNPGFEISVPLLHRMAYAVYYGDLMMCLCNQIKPYEITKGDADRLFDAWVDRIIEEMKDRRLSYKKIKENYRAIVRDFASIPVDRSTPRVKVGIVGEIYVKFSPLGNNDLESFLNAEGAEVVMPGLADFCLYCVYNNVLDYELYGRNKRSVGIWRFAYKFLVKKQRDMIDAIREIARETGAPLTPPTSFEHTKNLSAGVISNGVKMGEGWLLTSEMLELIEAGVYNIICTQPFGCLPNHIAGKGMMKPIKELHPEANIIAVDYDPGATQINQENRIKLMLANAVEQLRRKEEARKSEEVSDIADAREHATV